MALPRALPRAVAHAGVAEVEVVALEVVMPAQTRKEQIIRQAIPVLRPEGLYHRHVDPPVEMPLQTQLAPFHLDASRIGTLAEEFWCPAPWSTLKPLTLIVMSFALSSTRHPCT